MAVDLETGSKLWEQVVPCPARRRYLAERNVLSGYLDVLVGSARSVISPKSPIDHQHVQPHEAHDRPKASHEKHDTDCKTNEPDRSDQKSEPLGPERSVGRQPCRKQELGICGFAHGHELSIDRLMKSTNKLTVNTRSQARRKPLPRAKYTQAEMRAIFERFQQQRPEPKGELDHVNPFTLLVAVVLSAQATDVGVNKATKALFKVADTPEKMLALGEEKVRDYIRTIGLYRNKAKNVILLSRKLLEEYGSVVPRDRDTLTTLPGVGRKTANVVVSMAFGQPTIAVDTHIFRIGNRLGMAPGKTPEEIEAILERRIPKAYLYHAHHWLILHGRYTCKARKPECENCIIADLCKAKDKTCSVPAPIVQIVD